MRSTDPGIEPGNVLRLGAGHVNPYTNRPSEMLPEGSKNVTAAGSSDLKSEPAERDVRHATLWEQRFAYFAVWLRSLG